MLRFPDRYRLPERPTLIPSSPAKVGLTLWLCVLLVTLFFSERISLELQSNTDPLARSVHNGAVWLKSSADNSGWSSSQNRWSDRLQTLYDNRTTFVGVRRQSSINAPSIAIAQPSTAPKIVIDPPQELSVPSKVLLLGASSMRSALGTELSRQLQQAGLEVHRHARLGTGLSRLDVYDWLTHSKNLLKEHQPELIIAQFIGNDCQGMVDANHQVTALFGVPEWDGAYQQRVRDFLTPMLEADLEVVLLGMPNVRPERYRANLEHANRLVEQVAAEEGVLFISLWADTSDENGSYTETIVIDERTYLGRHEDGIHLSQVGARKLSKTVFNKLDDLYGWSTNQIQ